MWKFVAFLSFLKIVGSDENFQSWVWDDHNFLYPVLPIAAPWSKDPKCRDDSRLLIKHLRNNTLWAMQMWDSSVKTPSGILYGSMYQLGNFDECLRVLTPIKAQYCLAQVEAKFSQISASNPYDLNPSPLSSVWTKFKGSTLDPSQVRRDTVFWGLCVPSSCNGEEMQTAINSYMKTINDQNSQKNDSTYHVKIPDAFCTKPYEENEFALGEILFWVFTCILILMTITSTIADYIPQNSLKHSKCHTLWMYFSAKRNVKSLFENGRSEKRNPLDVLHGIKFASIIFVVLGHRVGIFLGLSAFNYQEVEELLRSDHNMFFVHSDLVVDTFFFISGLLVCYIFLPVFSKRFVNPIYAILARLSRLAPAYFFVLWFQTSAVLRLGSGPLWNIIAKAENDFCVSNWWTNVLFINNYVYSDKICMPHSWFIPCDLHFFIISIPIILLLVKKQKIGIWLLSILTIVSIIIPGIITFINNLQPLVIFYFDFLAQPRNDITFNVLYMRSHNRITVYFIGMMTGYFLHTTRNSEKKISLLTTLFGCIAWLGLMFAPMIYGSLYYDLERPYNPIEAGIFASLRRVSWAVGFSFFIISHRFGNIPIIGPIFSSKIATALSNITYGIYLIHFNLIMSHMEKTRSPSPFRVYEAILEGFQDLATSMLLATALLLMLEWPFKQIFRELLFSKKMDKTEKKRETKPNYQIKTISSVLEMEPRTINNNNNVKF